MMTPEYRHDRQIHAATAALEAASDLIRQAEVLTNAAVHAVAATKERVELTKAVVANA